MADRRTLGERKSPVHQGSFAVAEQVMRCRDALQQAGFNADLVAQIPPSIRPPLLHAEGKLHRKMRTTSARYFTPKATEGYRDLMETFADGIVAEFRERGEGDLSLMGLRMAAHVVRHVLGLTESDVAGFERRFDAAIARDSDSGSKVLTAGKKRLRRASLLNLYLNDIRPAVRARKKSPREDLISNLIELNYSPIEMLIECLMYGVAGVLTTREFICACMLHFDADPPLRRQFVSGNADERKAILYEILRVEPIVGALHRRTTRPLTIETPEGPLEILKGEQLDIDVYAVNADPAIVGSNPERVCPHRNLGDQRQPIYSFGAGPHRCPGEWIAIQETEILLRKLLEVETLEVVKLPSMGINDGDRGLRAARLHPSVLSVVTARDHQHHQRKRPHHPRSLSVPGVSPKTSPLRRFVPPLKA